MKLQKRKSNNKQVHKYAKSHLTNNFSKGCTHASLMLKSGERSEGNVLSILRHTDSDELIVSLIVSEAYEKIALKRELLKRIGTTYNPPAILSHAFVTLKIMIQIMCTEGKSCDDTIRKSMLNTLEVMLSKCTVSPQHGHSSLLYQK